MKLSRIIGYINHEGKKSHSNILPKNNVEKKVKKAPKQQANEAKRQQHEKKENELEKGAVGCLIAIL